MNIKQVAAQLYTLRDFLKTPGEIGQTLKKVRAIGYEAVQLSGLGPIGEDELVKMLDGEGLICCATHEGSDTIILSPGAVVDRLNKLNCRFTAYPWPAGVDFSAIESVRAFAAALNASGKTLHDSGKVLTYHNHHIEFRRLEGRPILDIIYSETDARYLQGEIDTYWVQHGGGNPVEWCRKLGGRLPLLHLKDYAINAENTPTFAEIGNGNLDWPRIVKTAEESGCEWFIVEQDVCPVDPFESLKMSFEYIKDTLCG